MFEDFVDNQTREVFEADVCIIGGGAAGITVARELSNAQLQICLLESGGFHADRATQDLYSGENVGLPYFPLHSTRLRYLGGTTNHWSGQCAPMSQLDFEKREWVPQSGWPMERADLDPFYERAQPICSLGEYVYDEQLFDYLELTQPELDPALLKAFFFRYSPPIRFGDAYRADLEAADNLRVVLNATAVDIKTDRNGSAVEEVVFKNLAGRVGRVRARAYVVACGGIENARVLLLSRGTNPNGLGNDYDLVGRYFMEHPEIPSGRLTTSDPFPLLDTYLRHWRDGMQYRPAFRTADETQREEGVLGACAVLEYVPREDSGTTAAIAIGRSVSNGEMPDDLGEKVWRMLVDLDELIPNVYRYVVEGKEPLAEPKTLYFKSMSEQAPNPESRVSLAEEHDALGLPRARLRWQVSEVDKRSIEVLNRCLGIEFGRLGMGRVRLDDVLNGEEPFHPRGGFHHMGTTRMSEDPKRGVVDPDCRVHSTSNLYVAGSSVFPTSGHVNPTLTLVALAVRLADHLREVL